MGLCCSRSGLRPVHAPVEIRVLIDDQMFAIDGLEGEASVLELIEIAREQYRRQFHTAVEVVGAVNLSNSEELGFHARVWSKLEDGDCVKLVTRTVAVQCGLRGYNVLAERYDGTDTGSVRAVVFDVDVHAANTLVAKLQRTYDDVVHLSLSLQEEMGHISGSLPAVPQLRFKIINAMNELMQASGERGPRSHPVLERARVAIEEYLMELFALPTTAASRAASVFFRAPDGTPLALPRSSASAAGEVVNPLGVREEDGTVQGTYGSDYVDINFDDDDDMTGGVVGGGGDDDEQKIALVP